MSADTRVATKLGVGVGGTVVNTEVVKLVGVKFGDCDAFITDRPVGTALAIETGAGDDRALVNTDAGWTVGVTTDVLMVSSVDSLDDDTMSSAGTIGGIVVAKSVVTGVVSTYRSVGKTFGCGCMIELEW